MKKMFEHCGVLLLSGASLLSIILLCDVGSCLQMLLIRIYFLFLEGALALARLHRSR